MKKYRLLKPFGIVKAGAIFEYDEENYVYWIYTHGAKRLEFHKHFVEDAKDWFEEIVKERSAKELIIEQLQIFDGIENDNTHVFQYKDKARIIIQALKDAGYQLMKEDEYEKV